MTLSVSTRSSAEQESLTKLNAWELAERIAEGVFSSLEVVEAHIRRKIGRASCRERV